MPSIKHCNISMLYRGLADLLRAGSNQLTEMLKDWNTVLQQSSIGNRKAINSNKQQDGDVPRVSRPAGGRRRKLA